MPSPSAPNATSSAALDALQAGRPVLRWQRRGFTLIELMTVVAMVAILATLAAPSLRDFLIRNRSAAISNEFTATVLRARSEAVSRNVCVSVCRSKPGASPAECEAGANWRTGWIAFANAACDQSALTPGADDLLVTSGPFDESFTFVSNTTSQSYMMFSPSGNARPGDAGRFDLLYMTETRPSNRGICVNPLGRTRLVGFGGTC